MQVWKPKIIVDQSVYDLPEVATLADETKLSVELAVGPLLRVWLWAQEHADDCGAAKIGIARLDVIAGQTGFGRGMQAAGLVEPMGPQSCRFLLWREFIAKDVVQAAHKSLKKSLAKLGSTDETGAKVGPKRGSAKKGRSSGPSKPPKPQTDEPAVLVFPCIGVGPSEWKLQRSQIDAWAKAFDLDVLAEMKKALAWIESNGRKTFRGYPKFCTAWLSRACNSGAVRRGPQYRTQKSIAQKALEEIEANQKRQKEIPW